MLFNKKGVVFTIIALVISSFVLLLFFYLMELPLDHKVEVTRAKVMRTNNFLFQLEDIAKMQAVISSRQAINEIVREMHFRGDFVYSGSSFDVEFVNCLSSGTFRVQHNRPTPCGSEANLKEKLEVNLSNFVRDNLGVNVVINVSNISIYQLDDPWFLIVGFDLNAFINESMYAVWNVSMRIDQEISIIGMKDPVFATLSDGPLNPFRAGSFENVSVISVDPYFVVVDGFLERPSTLNVLALNGSFFQHNLSPSFLDRLRGNFSNSSLGIASIVIPKYHGVSGIIIERGGSNLDWNYWHDEPYPSGPVGEYDFSTTDDKIFVLAIDPTNETALKNSIHKARIPVSLAVAANLSNSSYFNS